MEISSGETKRIFLNLVVDPPRVRKGEGEIKIFISVPTNIFVVPDDVKRSVNWHCQRDLIFLRRFKSFFFFSGWLRRSPRRCDGRASPRHRRSSQPSSQKMGTSLLVDLSPHLLGTLPHRNRLERRHHRAVQTIEENS